MPLLLALALAVRPVHVETIPEPSSDDLQELAPRTVGVRASTHLGLMVGREHDFVTLGLDLQLALRHLRVVAFAEAGGALLGPELATVGAAVGVGTASYGSLDGYLAPELGIHHYAGLGTSMFSSTVAGGTANLPFVGLRGALTWHVGPGRHFGVGITGMARADLGRRSVPATVHYQPLLGDEQTAETRRSAGWASAGLAVHAALRF